MSKTKQNKSPKEDLPVLFADTNVTMKTGHLTKDPEAVADGKFIKLRIAANKQYLGPDEEIHTLTNYFTALISSNLTDAYNLAQNLGKGDWVYLKGEDSTRSFDTPEGYKQTANTIFAYKLTLKKKAALKEEQTKAPSEAEPAPN